MAKMSKIVPCVDCQEMFPRERLNRMGRCRSCAAKAMEEASWQMKQKQGPYYKRWKEGIRRAIDRA